jgi:hypothetical protein
MSRKILPLLNDCDKPILTKYRHKVSKKDIEEYYSIEDEINGD